MPRSLLQIPAPILRLSRPTCPRVTLRHLCGSRPNILLSHRGRAKLLLVTRFVSRHTTLAPSSFVGAPLLVIPPRLIVTIWALGPTTNWAHLDTTGQLPRFRLSVWWTQLSRSLPELLCRIALKILSRSARFSTEDILGSRGTVRQRVCRVVTTHLVPRSTLWILN